MIQRRGLGKFQPQPHLPPDVIVVTPLEEETRWTLHIPDHDKRLSVRLAPRGEAPQNSRGSGNRCHDQAYSRFHPVTIRTPPITDGSVSCGTDARDCETSRGVPSTPRNGLQIDTG